MQLRRDKIIQHKRGQCVRVCTLLLALCVFAGPVLLASAAEETGSSKVTQESIDEKKAAIEDSRSQRQEISDSLTDLQNVKAQLESSKEDLTAYVTQLDGQLTEMQAKISSLEAQIADKEEEIEKAGKELEQAKQQQSQQYENMKKRIQFIYEKGDLYPLEALLSSGSISEMLNKATYIDMLSSYDANLLEQYQAQTQLVTLTEEGLEEDRTTLQTARDGVASEQAAMQALMEEKQAQVQTLTANIGSQQQSIEQYEQQMAEQDSQIEALEQQVKKDEETLQQQKAAEAAAAAAAAAAAEGYRYTGGQFVWPAPSSTKITSYYGNRVHPIYGVTRFHSGLDLAAPMGSPILAAANGVVVAADYNSSMGNYVMIDHGDGLFTIYMHSSMLECSKGDKVTAGQEIAKVGSTGASTGPHLHFSVRKDGQYVDPTSYLGTLQTGADADTAEATD